MVLLAPRAAPAQTRRIGNAGATQGGASLGTAAKPVTTTHELCPEGLPYVLALAEAATAAAAAQAGADDEEVLPASARRIVVVDVDDWETLLEKDEVPWHDMAPATAAALAALPSGCVLIKSEQHEAMDSGDADVPNSFVRYALPAWKMQGGLKVTLSKTERKRLLSA